MSDTKLKQCFVNFHCSYDCPNFKIDTVNEKYGYGIADDMGLKRISCNDCWYNSKDCKDCFFEYSRDCPEYNQKTEGGVENE